MKINGQAQQKVDNLFATKPPFSSKKQNKIIKNNNNNKLFIKC